MPKYSPVKVLENYLKILEKGEIKQKHTLEEIELFLSGIVKSEAGRLKVYNRIYESVFPRSWVEQQLQILKTSIKN